MDIRKELKDKRPNLSDSSITTYSSILRNLFKRVFPDQEMSIDKFNDTKKILEHLHEIPPSKRKTILSALLVITNNKQYKESMMSDITEYEKLMETNQKSETQKENWLTFDQIMTVLKNLEDETKLLYKKKHLTMSDLQQIQNYVILALLSGKYIAPRRSLDYCCMKVRNIKKNEDNWFDDKHFYFSKYKTAKFYHNQIVDIPPALRKIIDKWVKQNNHCDWLFFDNNSAPLTSVKLNQRLNKILGNGRAVNSCRHAFLCFKYGDTLKLNDEIKKTMSDMGSSQNMLGIYLKKDD